jgi:hypothetical protein
MARSPRTVVTWIIIAGFVAFLAWTTLRGQRRTCEVCVTFGAGKRCATASADDDAEAKRSAQTTACGPLAQGMDATIACSRVVPDTVSCRGS